MIHAHSQNQTPDNKGAVKPPGDSKPLILIVGPDEDTRYMLRVILELWEYEVLEAENLDTSITLGSSHHPSVILLDTTAHFTDVLDDIRQLKQEDGFRDVPSVLLSGYSQETYRSAALSSGASGFLVKPIDFDLLHAYIESLAGGNNSGTSAATNL